MGKVAALGFSVLGLWACHPDGHDAPPLDPAEENGGAGSPSLSSPDETASTAQGGADGGDGVMRADTSPLDDGGLILVADGGWIEEESNPFGIHGAVFAHADSTTSESLSSNIEGTRWCLAGTAAKVDLKCEIVPPARDCFDMRFGAILSVNLNQAHSGEPEALEPKTIKGFSFELSGKIVPKFLRFTADAEDAVYCKRDSVAGTPPSGDPTLHSQVLLSDLIHASCHESTSTGPSLVMERAKLVTLNWSLGGSYIDETPFDFCIENFRVLTE